MLSMVSKELGKAHFKAMMSWTTAVQGVAVTSADSGFKADLGVVVRGQGTRALRAG